MRDVAIPVSNAVEKTVKVAKFVGFCVLNVVVVFVAVPAVVP